MTPDARRVGGDAAGGLAPLADVQLTLLGHVLERFAEGDAQYARILVVHGGEHGGRDVVDYVDVQVGDGTGGVAERVKDGALIDVQLRGIHPLEGHGMVRIQHKVYGVPLHTVQSSLGEGHLVIARVAGLPDVQEAGVDRPPDGLVEGGVERPGLCGVDGLHQARRYRVLDGDGYVGDSRYLVARQVRDGPGVDVQLGGVHRVQVGGPGGVQLERGKGALDGGRPREGNPAAALVLVPDVEEWGVDRKGHRLAKGYPDGVAVGVVDGTGDGRLGRVAGRVGDQPQDAPGIGRVGGASRLKGGNVVARGQAGNPLRPVGVADVEHMYAPGHHIGAAVYLQGIRYNAATKLGCQGAIEPRGPDRLVGVAHVHQLEAGAAHRQPGAAPDCQCFHPEASIDTNIASRVVEGGRGGVVRVGHVQYLQVAKVRRADCRVGAVSHHERVDVTRRLQVADIVRPGELAHLCQIVGVGEVYYTHSLTKIYPMNMARWYQRTDVGGEHRVALPGQAVDGHAEQIDVVGPRGAGHGGVARIGDIVYLQRVRARSHQVAAAVLDIVIQVIHVITTGVANVTYGDRRGGV